MKRKKSNLCKGTLFTLLWTFCLCVYAQNVTVKGTVVDVKGEPLMGVTIQVKGGTMGTITDMDGNFTL